MSEFELDGSDCCCGRKPIEYRGRHTASAGPHRYCPRCDRAYELDAPFQMNNWAWKKVNGAFERQTSVAGSQSPKETKS